MSHILNMTEQLTQYIITPSKFGRKRLLALAISVSISSRPNRVDIL